MIKTFKKKSPAGTKKDGGGYVGRLCWRWYRGTSRGSLCSVMLPQIIGVEPNFVKRILLLFLAVVILFPTFQPSAFSLDKGESEKPYIDKLEISYEDGCLETHFILKNPFPPKIKEALESGVPIKYRFNIELQSPRFLRNKRIVKRTIEKTLFYDAIKGEFRIISSKGTRVVTVPTLQEAEKEAFNIKNFPICTISKLKKGKIYLLKVKATAEKGDAFLPFEGLIEIFTRWGFSTDWHEIKFAY